MWKYRCKMQLIALSVAFAAGVALMAFALKTGAGLAEAEYLPAEVAAYMTANPVISCLWGGMVIAGIANVILVSQLLTVQFGLSPIFIYLFLFIIPQYCILAGTILVIPMVCLSIYGIWSLHTGRSAAFKRAGISNDEQIIRTYEIHHALLPEYKALGQECRRNVVRATSVYVLGIVAVMSIIFLVDNIWITMAALLFYMMAFNLIARYRSSCMIPITKLLYEECNPEACISALIYYSTNRRGKIKLSNQSLMAQALIYLNDPQLAQDVLITYPRKDAASVLTYWSLMAYIYYLLKDEQGLQRCYEEASKVRLNFGSTGVMIRSEELSAIENKIHLMDGDFNACKKYFLESLKKARFPFQKADACYYIGLISFVQEDYSLARMYFQKVVQLGNKLYFTENAKAYLEKIDAFEQEEQRQYELPAA